MATSESLYDLLSTAAFVLERCSRDIVDLPFEPVRLNVDRLGKVLGEVLMLQGSLLSTYPTLDPGDPDDPEHQPALSASDREFAMCLVEAARLERNRQVPEAVTLLERYLVAEVSLARRGVIAAEIERLVACPQNDGAPDLRESEAVLAHVGALSPSELEEIDRTLLAGIDEKFQKVAFVIASAMNQLADRLPPVPDVFYAQRVIRLVKLGLVEAQGDLRRMRDGEVRRAG